MKIPALLRRLVPSGPPRALLEKPWLKWLGYPAFFFVALVVAIYATFPYDALRDRVTAELRNRFATEVEIGSVRLAGLSGITLRDVAVPLDGAVQAAPPPPAVADADAPEGAPPPAPPPVPRLSVDRITAKAELLSLLSGKQAFTFDVEAWGGTAEGRVERGEDLAIEARLRKVDLALAPLRALAGVDLGGRVESVDLELTAAAGDLAKANGKVTLLGEELLLSGGDVQGFELPKMALGKLEGNVVIENGKATFDGFGLKGEDLEAVVEGFVRLSPRLSASTLSGKLKVKPSDAWWNRNEMIKSMASFALPAGKDGWRAIGVYGQLGSPNFRPQR